MVLNELGSQQAYIFKVDKGLVDFTEQFGNTVQSTELKKSVKSQK